MKTRSVVVIVVLVAACACTAYAQKESEIVAKFRAALIRGAEDIPEPPIILKGKITMGAIVMDGVIYYKKPNNRIEMSFSGMKFITLQNDSLRWTYNPVDKSHKIQIVTKKEINDERQREMKLDFASKDLLFYKSRGSTLKSLGIKKVDSVETYALQLTMPDKTVVDYFINTKTNLMYKVQSGDDFRIYANYQRHGDYVYPSFMSTLVNSGQMDMLMNEIIINASISPDLFVVPQEAHDAIKKNDSKAETMIAHADSLYSNGNYKEAIDEYTLILSEHGRIFRAFNGRGLCKLALKEYYDAVADFNAALSVVPKGSNALNNRGLAKYYIGDTKGALEDYAAAIEADSMQVSARTNRGLLYFNQEKYPEAVAEYKVAIRLRPGHPDSRLQYGRALAQNDQYEEAIAQYNEAISLGMDPSGVYNFMGVAHYSLENYDSAAVQFENALKVDKENLQYIQNYGNTLYNLGRYKEAVKQYDHYNSVDNSDAEVHNMIGLCKYQEEDYKGAIEKFSRSIELKPKNATYFDNRASAKENIEDYQGAINDYSESISIYPNDAEVFYKRGLLKIKTSKKMEGCMDLGTANEMKHEGAKEAILQNCH